MPFEVHPPLGVAWTSLSLYKEVPSEFPEFPFGRAVAVDGWDEALTTAWQQILA